jgi:hypothetical protein
MLHEIRLGDEGGQNLEGNNYGIFECFPGVLFQT